MLEGLGAVHVLNSSADGFDAALASKIRELQVRVAFDCVAGETAGQLLAALPPGGTLFAYGRLSSSYLAGLPVIDLIYRGKMVEGFLLTTAFRKLGAVTGLVQGLVALRTAKHGLTSTFATSFTDVGLDEVVPRVLAIDPQKPGAKSVTNAKMRVRF